MKKILKKVAATILAASMVIGMTACGWNRRGRIFHTGRYIIKQIRKD